MVDGKILLIHAHSWNNKTEEDYAVEPVELIVILALRLSRRIPLERMLRVGKTYPFADFFKGLEKTEAVKKIFGDDTEKVLRNLKVEFTVLGGYMRTSPKDGHIVVNTRYLNQGDRVDVYLDLIHELVHVKQFMEGKELFDPRYGYVDRPTEIEAYRHTVEEARRLGLNKERICSYLKTEWMTKKDLERLARSLNMECP